MISALPTTPLKGNPAASDLVAIYIVYEAYQRFTHPAEIQSVGMMIVAVIGLVINLISMKILSASAQESLNVKGAYLEVLSDALGSIGVIIGRKRVQRYRKT